MAEQSDFARLFLPIQADLLAYILTMGVPPEEADDVLQDSASIMLRKMTAFELGTNFRAWAYAVVKREILRALKARAGRPLSLTEAAYDDIAHLATTASEVPTVRLSALTVCLEKVKKSARAILFLRYRDGLDPRKIAATLNRPVDTVYKTLYRIRQSLHLCIERLEQLQEKRV